MIILVKSAKIQKHLNNLFKFLYVKRGKLKLKSMYSNSKTLELP